MILLFLVVYIFSIMSCLMMGANDTARFGTVTMSMLTLFQVSTLCSWTSIAYTSMFGCRSFWGDSYTGVNLPNATTGEWGDDDAVYSSIINTKLGMFQGHRCDKDQAQPVLTFAFFSVYVVLTSWVIMSLFIGVISIGMFDAFENMKEEKKNETYRRKLAEHAAVGDGGMAEKAAQRNASKRRGSFNWAVPKEEDLLAGPEKLAFYIDQVHA